ncbi:MAG: hypothetical protein UT66_C0009G0017 [candidate division CPR2 bacterium GW2011_GWC1_39_9]|uniref:Uncharacterized protein n=1 Tax=candidate division CPR2 bacterium GW2011_GWC2_39_10 TaxID=1618345 RepID=A0A0G0M3Y9_UNCC2|nr:MAG: hypothetical protein UT18_C0004G0022 [candidate division CPR2 bacterium GW2011_GWC2_39_10]KKR35654.1 MAG: hypothetical protein UT66_C0009G0017 [candidate division CPR2 bacterium GW2011_GWC1_39_9]
MRNAASQIPSSPTELKKAIKKTKSPTRNPSLKDAAGEIVYADIFLTFKAIKVPTEKMLIKISVKNKIILKVPAASGLTLKIIKAKAEMLKIENIKYLTEKLFIIFIIEK